MTEDSQDDKSRSQIKREFRQVKDLGIQLSRLTERQLRAIPLTDKARDAVLAAKKMTRKALPRHYRHLVSLLMEEDVDAIRAGLAGELQPHSDEVAALHEAEEWRDRLLDDDDQVSALVEQYPDCDRKHLRQLVRNARTERELDQPPKSARQLFRYLKKLSDSQDQK